MLSRSLNIFLMTCCLLAVSRSVSAQDMYPGDVTNNGVVNGVDVLFWGLAAGSTGPVRPGATNDFIPQALPAPWDQNFPNGLNFAYADCDGDGEVAIQDLVQTIRANYGLQWTTPVPDNFNGDGTPGFDPFLAATPAQPTYTGGETVDIDFSLGTVETPVTGFYGLTFRVEFNLDIVDPGNDPDYEFPGDPWFADGSEWDKLKVPNISEGWIDVAITRTNQEPIDGHGSMGSLNFVIIEDVVDAIAADTVFAITDVMLVKDDLSVAPVVLDTSGTTAVRILREDAGVKVYPNPARDHLFIQADDLQLESVQLRNTLGQPFAVHVEAMGPEAAVISTAGIPGGWYVLEMYTSERKVVVRKIFISK